MFANYLVKHQVQHKIIQILMGHKDAKSTEWYTRVFAQDVTRQLGVRFSMDPDEAGLLILPRQPPFSCSRVHGRESNSAEVGPSVVVLYSAMSGPVTLY
ncbi:site-specific integrase [Pantoea stewartii]|nr:site-specific integrase [Pantoea stewartii]MCU7369278.1 site-specific integrase [Pantoea stewartii]